MNILDGWVDQFIDNNNDIIVILASNNNDLLAYSNRISQIGELKKRYKSDGKDPDEFDEVIYARYGTKIDFLTTCEIFPSLKDKNFWGKTWLTYDGESYKEIFKKYKGSI